MYIKRNKLLPNVLFLVDFFSFGSDVDDLGNLF